MMRSKNKTEKIENGRAIRRAAIFLIVLTFAACAIFTTRAWWEPNVSPPGGNVAAPIHTGTAPQSKAGHLYVQGADYGLYGYETDTGAYGLLGYAGYGGYFNGPIYSNSYLYSTIIYDTNNSGYYSDPNSTSRLNYTVNNNVYSYGWMQATWYPDANDNNYYVDPNGTTRLNTLCLSGTCYSSWPSSAETLQTVTNRGWTTSQPLYSSNYMQAPIFYDANNSGYYLDPNGSSRLNRLYYVDQAYIVDVRPQYMYDWNDSNYYMDFNNTSILNDLRANIFYDKGNTGYYLDPAGTSRLNYTVFDTTYTYGETNANVIRGRSQVCIGNDCRGSWPTSAGARCNTNTTPCKRTSISASTVPTGFSCEGSCSAIIGAGTVSVYTCDNGSWVNVMSYGCSGTTD